MKEQMKIFGGETLIDALMSYVFPVVGGTVGIIILKRLTHWPFALCAVVGFLAGVLLIWAILLGVMACVNVFAQSRKRNKTTE